MSAAEQPILQQIQAERAANLAKAQQQMGFAKAAAALLQGGSARPTDVYERCECGCWLCGWIVEWCSTDCESAG